MKLTLRFYRDEDSCETAHEPWEFNWSEMPSASSSKQRECIPDIGEIDMRLSDIGEMCFVRAEIEGKWDPSWHMRISGGEYDEYFNGITPSDGGGVFWYSKRGQDPKYRRQLFRGAQGRVLLRIDYGRKSRDCVFSVWLNIRVSDERIERFFAMAGDLCPTNPFLVISMPRGVFASNRIQREISKEPKAKRHIHGSLRIEVSILGALIKLLFPYLQAISRTPMFDVVSTCKRRCAGLVHRPTVSVLRLAQAKSLYYGGMGLVPVSENARRLSDNTMVHRLILGFLCKRYERLEVIASELKENIERWENPKDLECLLHEGFSGNKMHEYQNELEEDRKLWQKVVRGLMPALVQMVNMGPWRNAKMRFDILAVSATSFDVTPEYRAIYSIMTTFEKVSNFWSEIAGDFLSIKYTVTDGSAQNRWLRNYSRVYEGWVFKRILSAFDEIGYSATQEYLEGVCRYNINSFMNQEVNRPVRVERDGLQIDIYYGINAPRLNKKKNDYGEELDGWNSLDHPMCRYPFRCVGITDRRDTGLGYLEPDYIICFKNTRKACSDVYWIVIDAKSVNKLKYEGGIKQREKYRSGLRFGRPTSAGWSECKPNQSWLIYAGGDTSGIEFNEETEPIDKLSWSDEDQVVDRSPSKCNAECGDVVWTAGGIQGIEAVGAGECLVGHVRSNALTTGKCDSIAEFVRVEELSVRKLFGL